MLVTISLEMDVAVSVDLRKKPPAITVQAKVRDAQLALKEFQLRRVGPVQFQEGLLLQELKSVIEGKLKEYEPKVKQLADQMIAEALKDGGKSLLKGSS